MSTELDKKIKEIERQQGDLQISINYDRIELDNLKEKSGQLKQKHLELTKELKQKRKTEAIEKEKKRDHHVILTKYGPDIYVDETTTESNYSDEKGRIENVAIIQGNIPDYELMLTQDGIVELRDILNILIEKESKRIGN